MIEYLTIHFGNSLFIMLFIFDHMGVHKSIRIAIVRLSSPKTEMASGIFVNESGRILVSLFFSIGKRVTILLPIFF